MKSETAPAGKPQVFLWHQEAWTTAFRDGEALLASGHWASKWLLQSHRWMVCTLDL